MDSRGRRGGPSPGGSKGNTGLEIAPTTATLKKPAAVFNPVIMLEIRRVLKKPSGELTKADLERVKMLYFIDSQLADLRPLAELPQLEELFLYDNPKLTKAEIDKLKKALPDCTIYHDFE
jgi:hypothetical protein